MPSKKTKRKKKSKISRALRKANKIKEQELRQEEAKIRKSIILKRCLSFGVLGLVLVGSLAFVHEKIKQIVSFGASYKLTLLPQRHFLDPQHILKSRMGLNSEELSKVASILSDVGVKRSEVILQKGPLLKLSELRVEGKDDQLLVIKPDYHFEETAMSVERMPIERAKKLKSFQGVVDQSIWDSVKLAGAEQSLAVRLSEIFAWQIDFNHEIKKGTKWRVLLKEKIVNGEHYGWGEVVAAELDVEGESYQAYLHHTVTGKAAYFDQHGDQVRRTFLKSPIKFARISSKFKLKRFHPILKRYRPHFGVDYAAKVGTPVRSVGDGVVIEIGHAGGAGKMLKIKHDSKHMTAYKHLKSYAQGLQVGAKVKQGEVIGAVGMTGLSTGAHLHFEFYRNGRYINPLSKGLYPQLSSIPAKELQEYKAEVKRRFEMLPAWPFLLAHKPQ